MKLKILLADDVEELAEAVGAMLEYNNYEVDIVNTGNKALEKAKENLYDCIILDVMMPIMNGFEVVKQIRKINIKTPIILLTAKSLVDDKVEGLDAGANDYLTKPFEKKELLARIRALTRAEEENREKYKIGNLIFNKESSQLLKDKTALNLSSYECDIIEIFIKNPERKISEEELKQRVWTNKKNNNSIVPMYITYLQEKFIALNANVKITDIDGYKLEKLI
ncbi:MAG: response regulator transcription factor [Clostridia bacterium]|nr:response regulator transcription factor [Clostridia bacterium]